MFAKLESLERKFLDLEQELADPTVFNDQDRYRKLTKAHSDLKPVVDIFRQYRELKQNLADNQELLNDADPDIREMAHEEIKSIEEKLPELEHDLKVLLLPTDPLDEKNIILEIRAGTGGEEAALFGGDLFRMYCRYAEKMGWKVEIMSQSESDNGGYKEVIALISGDKVYSRLKFESGTHRVQRVPATESQGRIHTSAATVAIMPEAEEVDLDLKPEDLRFDVYRSSGPGGQSVNTTDSAVRITHLPTGIVVTCQNERSQIQNKAACMQILKARLYELELEKREEALDQIRGPKHTIGFGNQIRSYVLYPYQMVKDLRSGVETGNPEAVLEDGDLDPFVVGYHRWATGNAEPASTTDTDQDD